MRQQRLATEASTTLSPNPLALCVLTMSNECFHCQLLKLLNVQYQGDSSAASYGGAGGAAGAIDEDDDGKHCNGHALTLQVSVTLFCLLCFLPSSCAVRSSDAIYQVVYAFFQTVVCMLCTKVQWHGITAMSCCSCILTTHVSKCDVSNCFADVPELTSFNEAEQ